jgi:hypothetical protein
MSWFRHKPRAQEPIYSVPLQPVTEKPALEEAKVATKLKKK